MKKSILAVALIVVPLLFFGCAATANVKYRAKDDIKKTNIPVALMASRVTIAMPATASTDNQASPANQKQAATAINMNPEQVTKEQIKKNAVIIVTPTQAEGSLRYLEPQDDLLRTTSLSITYFDGIKVPKTVGVVVEDRSVKMISAFGTLIAAAIPIVAAAPPTPPPTPPPDIYLPILLDFSKPEVFGNTQSGVCKQLDGKNTAYGVCYKITPREGREKNEKKEMYTYTEFYNAYEDTFTSNLAFSRCADLDVNIVNWQSREVLAFFAATIADPYHVDWLPMPLQGSITAQGVCGANSTTEKSDTPGVPGVMDELAKQIDAIWKALHPPKE